ncbi:MAG: type II toxin-antitoxin system RelE/ParE family toxin [Chitinophagales bacterium]
MKYNLILTADAQQEETDAYNYYENIRAGLGESLLIELEKSYNKIAETPFYYSYLQTSKMLRDIKVERFPYLVIYLVSGNTLTVLSIRNIHRRPFI